MRGVVLLLFPVCGFLFGWLVALFPLASPCFCAAFARPMRRSFSKRTRSSPRTFVASRSFSSLLATRVCWPHSLCCVCVCLQGPTLSASCACLALRCRLVCLFPVPVRANFPRCPLCCLCLSCFWVLAAWLTFWCPCPQRGLLFFPPLFSALLLRRVAERWPSGPSCAPRLP
ncbi:hypothetical protein, conserved in T. vivax [Trypanosoma vivax Y486]|uniref:Uncharacterized protein n=1 Tax=Trypanosoma vivax (strain Y486) TaxID=1055687 RepID=F9WT98_TRYVY|nr:hypothetical protein, conserved in T. vivax [Trypanosoma vivax Y486]|eukprot:CCD20791.1 hypothetical protein, conserved in T. vivax [Trypanosoma vivax Y486]